MVVFDAAVLMHLLRPDVGPPRDIAGMPIPKWKERLALLVADLQKSRTKIVIPAPALSELLVRAGAEGSQRLVEEIGKSSIFRIEAFDALAAIEVAAITRQALEEGDKRGGVEGTWAKIKYDRQIVAIARAAQATAIYSSDAGIRSLGERLSLRVVGIADLPMPPENPQFDMFEEMSPDEAEIAAAEIAAQTAADQSPP